MDAKQDAATDAAMGAVRNVTAIRRYLCLPVEEQAPKQYVSLSVNGEIVRQFEMKLASGAPDYWVYADLRPYAGNDVTIAAEHGDAEILEKIVQRDELPDGEQVYAEALRPQFHFSSRRGWLNDPNGLLYYNGEYHLFYQHNPYGREWGNMHWGHAVSRDLVHWEEREEALYPDRMGTMWSGSGVVDRSNTSGFQSGAEAPLVLLYTAAGGTSPLSQDRPFTQCLAYSRDGGRTWTKYAHNPVVVQIAPQNRDPKVVWLEPSQEWIMVLYVDENEFSILSSPNLKQWEPVGRLAMPGCAECPDLFELPVDGDPGNRKWVLWAATRGAYRIGRFEGKRFVPESEVLHAVPEGAHSYAAQTWSGIPEEDGRCIQISWANVQIPDMPFNGYMTFPCELTLRTTEEGLRLFVYPVREIETIRGKRHLWNNVALEDDAMPIAVTGELLDIAAEFEASSASEIGFRIHGTTVTYNVREQVLTYNQVSSPLKLAGGRIKLRILVDRTSIEIYGNDGAVYMPVGVIRKNRDNRVDLFAYGGMAAVVVLDVFELSSIWRQNPGN